MDELENELSNIVGLHEIKIQLRKWAKGMFLDERRKALGLKVGARRPPHMAFLGNPGTGNLLLLVSGSVINWLSFFYFIVKHGFYVGFGICYLVKYIRS
ncbi:hypothetical protein SLA2020_230120 [Shorea laevis]